MKTFMMKVDFISDLGVTGSNHLLQVRAQQLKIYQGREDVEYSRVLFAPFLSYGHILL